LSMTSGDRLYLWVGVNLTAAPSQNSVAELDVEGALNGNFDSTITVPLPNPPPSISGLTPDSGTVGAYVNVAGTNFGATQGTSTITFNGTAATPTSWSATNIVAQVPPSATTGPVVVAAQGQASNEVTFTVTSSGTIAGTITRTSDGAAVSGALVEALQASVVNGSTTSAANGSYSLVNLPPGTYDVRIVVTGYQTRIQNGVVVTASNTTTVNQSLDVLSPNGDIEYVYDELGRLIATITSTETVRYAYDAVGNLLSISRGTASQVSIIEFTPNSGSIDTTVTIYGTAFSSVPSENTVRFNGVVAIVTSATATRIVTSVPAGASTGPISVTSPAGTATSSTPFVVGTPGAPTITGFDPTIGTVGASVTITGTNFEFSPYTSKTKFNKTLASMASATTTEIVTSVPSQAASGRISVETPLGLAVSSGDFFIVPAPRTPADVGMTGRITIGESKVVSIPAAGKIAIIVFDGAAGQWVSIGTSNSTISAVSCCTTSRVTIYKPDGTTLLAPTDFYQLGGGTPSVKLPVSGTYTILVEPFSNLVGSVTLWLSEDLSPPISINGPAVTLTNRVGQNARLLFSGNTGQRVSVGVSDTTIGAVSCCTTSKVAIERTSVGSVIE
jgi:YD repeat-containing protein